MYNDYLLTKNKSNCYGCRACEEACPKNCINMREDEETFLYPVVDIEKCINCNLCHKVCPANTKIMASDSSEKNAVAFVHKDENVVFNSSSGGAFTAILENVVDENTVVFGVSYDENLQVKHDFALSLEDTVKFRKSKYVQSNTNGCFKKAKEFLNLGKKVVFTGTPCQIAALKNYLGNINYENLFCIDLVCHGVPSQRLFDMHVSEISRLKKVVEFNFRYKKISQNGMCNSRTAEIKREDNSVVIAEIRNDAFLKAYYSRLIYRPSCRECKYASPNRVSDMTIADAWGIEKKYSELNALAGCSLIISNNEKGRCVLEQLSSKMRLYDVGVQWATENNEQLRKPTTMHKNREKFFASISSGDSFGKAVDKALKRSFVVKIISKIKSVLNRAVR